VRRGRRGRCRPAAGASDIIRADTTRRDGRVAEGGGLLNRCRVKSSTGGSNPPLSASESFSVIFSNLKSHDSPYLAGERRILVTTENRVRGGSYLLSRPFLCHQE
jgi:hypothetical protein